jgi:hypothetical protein
VPARNSKIELDMSEVRVTYYLGAGASANAVPMVSQIRPYYRRFLSFIDVKSTRMAWEDGALAPTRERTIELFNEITEKLESHHTPDTYAKKLWLKEQKDELRQLKIYLALFFYWIENGNEINLGNKKSKFPKGGIDERYDPFLATHLKQYSNHVLRFPPNINIITWNYDCQFENAYSSFTEGFDYDKIRENLYVVPKPSNLKYQSGLSRLIKINGCSRLMIDGGEHTIKSVKEPFLHLKADNFPTKWIREFSTNSLRRKKNLYTPLINFAWETDNPASQEALKEAKDVFSKTQVLVIIGYSFPTFNRDVDKGLFERLRPDCTVYYQAPESVVHELIDKLKSVRHITKEVKPVINLDQFHIPIQL